MSPQSDFEALVEHIFAKPANERADYIQRMYPDTDHAEILSAVTEISPKGDTLWDALSDHLPNLIESLRRETFQPPEVEGYEILRKLGEGGMGRVFLARKVGATPALVALKVMKADITEDARFDAERLALAAMNHAALARFIDAGKTKDNRPWLAMEYFPGLPVTRFCKHFKLDPDKRIAIFRSICEGVHHAHQRGLIHRDLKPGNILAAFEGDQIRVKILDWGIAKNPYANQGETRPGTVMGTPLYISPEQVDTFGRDIDVRTDVYSLGVMLYELLAGQPPFDLERFDKCSMEDLLQIVKYEAPPAPVQRLKPEVLGLEDARTAKHWRRRLGGEVGQIIQKAMAKDRTHRYDSVTDLAADLENYQTNRPVNAAGPSPGYILKKWLRRHRPLVMATALGMVAITIGIAAAINGYQRALHAEQEARQALRNYQESNAFLEDLLTGADPRIGGPNTRLLDLVNQASATVKWGETTETQALIHESLGKTYLFLGEYDKATRHLDESVRIFEVLFGFEYEQALFARVYRAVVERQQGEFESALNTLDLIAKRLSSDQKGGKLTCLVAMERAANLSNLGNQNEAMRLYQDIIELEALSPCYIGALTGFANAVHHGDPRKAIDLYQTALDHQLQALGKTHPQVFVTEANLRYLQAQNGTFEAVAAPYRSLLGRIETVLDKGHPVRLRTASQFAWVLHSADRMLEAKVLYETILPDMQKQFGDHHEDTLNVNTNLAIIYTGLKDFNKALAYSTQAVDGYRLIYGDDHETTIHVQVNHALLIKESGDQDQAIQMLRDLLRRTRADLGPEHDLSIWIYSELSGLEQHTP